MTQVISDFKDYKPRDLHDLLMGKVKTGDAGELHSACIALCNIVQSQERRIAEMEKRLGGEPMNGGVK